VGGFLRLPAQRGFIEGQQPAVAKHDAAADHDGIDGCAVLAEYHLNEWRAQRHEMRAVQLQEYDVGLIARRQPADFVEG
jgi:hypothetical protein